MGEFDFLCVLCVFTLGSFVIKKTINTKAAKTKTQSSLREYFLFDPNCSLLNG